MQALSKVDFTEHKGCCAGRDSSLKKDKGLHLKKEFLFTKTAENDKIK